MAKLLSMQAYYVLATPPAELAEQRRRSLAEPRANLAGWDLQHSKDCGSDAHYVLKPVPESPPGTLRSDEQGRNSSEGVVAGGEVLHISMIRCDEDECLLIRLVD